MSLAGPSFPERKCKMASEDGGPAYPQSYRIPGHSTVVGTSGLSIRQYAAITLRVPNSGTDWLDAMIRESLRDEFAAKAMQSIVGMMYHTENLPPENVQEIVEAKVYTFPSSQLTCVGDQRETAQTAYAFADAMLAARKEAADANRD